MEWLLRTYQKRVIDGLGARFRNGANRLLVHAPTGSGKTIIAARLAKNAVISGWRVLFVTHRLVLAEQSAAVFRAWDIDTGIVGDGRRESAACTVGMLQTLCRPDNAMPDADICIIDEVHYGWDCDSLKALLGRLRPGTPVIGLSATPIDGDGYLIDGFDGIVSTCQVRQLIAEGHLVKPRVVAPMSPNVHALHMRGGDYASDEAAELMSQRMILTDLVDAWVKHARSLKTACYAVNIDHCEQIAERFRQADIAAEAYHSRVDADTRDAVMRRFASGETQVVVNVDMLTVGWDDPSVGCIMLARPTRSVGYYLQIVGRGLRPAPGKTDCLILDCACTVQDNGMPDAPRTWGKRPLYGATVDKLVICPPNDSQETTHNHEDIPQDLHAPLMAVSSLIELYAEKTYRHEAELLADLRNLMDKWGVFYWRQNSGVAKYERESNDTFTQRKEYQWVHFTNLRGLPDLSVFVHGVYIGIEVKLPGARFTEHQRSTLPMMHSRGLAVFVVTHPVELLRVMIQVHRAIKCDGGTISIDRQALLKPDEHVAKLIKRQEG